MADFDQVQDSGRREEMSTGSVRDSRAGKGRYDLITPLGLRRLAKHYENGSTKYGDRNWEKGQTLSRYLDSIIRHAYCYLEGKRDEDHLAAICWGALAMMHTEEAIERGLLPKELDDMPNFTKLEQPKDMSNFQQFMKEQ
jgi:hypothetical protein